MSFLTSLSLSFLRAKWASQQYLPLKIVVIITLSQLLSVSALIFLSFLSIASARTNNSEKPQLLLFLYDLEMLNIDTDLFAYKPRLWATTLGFGAESQPLGLLSLGCRAWWAHWQPFETRSPVLQSSISLHPLCHSPTTGLGWLVSHLSSHGDMEKIEGLYI